MPRITINIMKYNGESKSIVVDISDTISRGKSLYGNESVQWIFNGEVLKDEKTFSDYDIEEGDRIISNERIRGMSMNIKVLVSGKEMIPIKVNKYSDSLNDLLTKLNENRPNKITHELITIGGVSVKRDEFSKTLNNWDLEDGDILIISQYYAG